MVYARRAGSATTAQRGHRRQDERGRFVLDDEEILRAGPLGGDHRGALRAARWTSSGPRTARPASCSSSRPARRPCSRSKAAGALKTYELKDDGEVLVTGLAIGDAIAAGKVHACSTARARSDRFEDGAHPGHRDDRPGLGADHEAAAGIVTDHGGRTSHAAIVSRELGVPAVIGTGDATARARGRPGGDAVLRRGRGGLRLRGRAATTRWTRSTSSNMPEDAHPDHDEHRQPGGGLPLVAPPGRGIGLARMEFIINNVIQIHPMALLRFDELEDEEAKAGIERARRAATPTSAEYFVDRLARGIATIAASQYPDPVIVRMSDFKTNEYADLIGGRQFEPEEENPMLGFRGASRYYSERLPRRLRPGVPRRSGGCARRSGFDNVVVMIPFCRTLEEADRVLEVMAENGLERGERGLRGLRDGRDPLQHHAGRASSRSASTASPSARNDLTQLDPRRRPRPGRARATCSTSATTAVKRLIAQLIETRPPRRPQGRHLRPGAQRLPGLRGVFGRARHRLHLAEPGQHRQDDGGHRRGRTHLAVDFATAGTQVTSGQALGRWLGGICARRGQAPLTWARPWPDSPQAT